MVKEAKFELSVRFSFGGFWRLGVETDERLSLLIVFSRGRFFPLAMAARNLPTSIRQELGHWPWLVAWESIV